MINSNHDDLCDPLIDPTTPRVEAVINEAMKRFPGVGNAAQARYYEAVHQELAPLARELERTCAEQSERIAGLTEQHGRDSAELRSLCAARDEAGERVKALTAKCALLAASLAQEEARSAELEKDAARYRWLRLDRTEDQTRFALDMIIDNCEKYLDEAIDSAIAAQKEASNG